MWNTPLTLLHHWHELCYCITGRHPLTVTTESGTAAMQPDMWDTHRPYLVFTRISCGPWVSHQPTYVWIALYHGSQWSWNLWNSSTVDVNIQRPWKCWKMDKVFDNAVKHFKITGIVAWCSFLIVFLQQLSSLGIHLSELRWSSTHNYAIHSICITYEAGTSQ